MKNFIVDWNPMVIVTPAKKRICIRFHENRGEGREKREDFNRQIDAQKDKLNKVEVRMGICRLTFPMASKPLSKKNSIPRNKKSMPRAVSPTPISASKHLE